MKIIKISSGSPEKTNLLLRQTKNFSGIWGDCKFYINKNIANCDWWFVLHGSGLVKSESCICDPDHIIYVSMEPDEKMSKVSNNFLSQFSCLVTCDRDVIHKNKIFENWVTWYVGIIVEKKNNQHAFQKKINLDYDRLSLMEFPNKKNRISLVISNKNFSEGHKKRIKFVEELKKLPIAKYIDIFGHGYNNIPDKWDAIAPYKYHIVLENSVQPDYWSEKLADSFLGFSLPIYYGCPNIYDYFDKDSLFTIDINDIKSTVKLLQYLLDHGENFEKRRKIINISRKKILNEYNIFNLMKNLAVSKALKNQKINMNTNAYYSNSLLKKIAKFILKYTRLI
ncbi:glycosyltransferase family 10 [Alphaproteobacteria bacterium]|nr:glycosyltransferase family 10 [Alphaproteobacteria bacterium]